MALLNIYVINSDRTREYLLESHSGVKEVSTEGGQIHIIFEDDSSCAGMHFPIPTNFSRLDFIEHGAPIGPLHTYEVTMVPRGPSTDDGLRFTILAASHLQAERQAKDIIERYHPGFSFYMVTYLG